MSCLAYQPCAAAALREDTPPPASGAYRNRSRSIASSQAIAKTRDITTVKPRRLERSYRFLRRKRRSWGILAEAAGFEVFDVLSSASACNQLSSAFPSGQPFCFQMKYARSAIWNCVSTFTTFLLCDGPSQPIQGAPRSAAALGDGFAKESENRRAGRVMCS